MDGSTADLVSPGDETSTGLTAFGTPANFHIDVKFLPASGKTIDPSSLTDSEQEIEVRLEDGTLLTVNGVPTQPGSLAGTNVWRYSLTGTLKPGRITVKFLEGSFADSVGVKNLEQVESFVLEKPTDAFKNVSDGASVMEDKLNTLATGQQAGLFDASATSCMSDSLARMEAIPLRISG